MTRSLSLPGQPLTVDDVNAMWDDIDAQAEAAFRAQVELTQRRLALRDAAWAGEPAEDLRWLDIDSPMLRWKAVRQYIRNLRRDHYRKVRRIWVSATFVDWAEGNAIARGVEPDPQWGVDTIARDWLEAAARVKHEWGEDAMHYVAAIFCPHLIEKRQRG